MFLESLPLRYYFTTYSKRTVPRVIVFCFIDSRHNRFGGALQVGGGNGTMARIVANPFKDQVDSVPQATRKRPKGGKTFILDHVSEAPSNLSER